MENPWLDLPSAPPFIAPIDRPVLMTLLRRCNLKLHLRPQPWLESPRTATVFVLALNPGFRSTDYALLRNADYAKQGRLTLSFKSRTPFYYLDPAFTDWGGYRYWARRLKALIAEVGVEVVAHRVMCVEHFPYRSEGYRPLGVTLPSQQYSFDLVRKAIKQGKVIVIMRSRQVWLNAVPELCSYPYIRLTNPRNPYLSRRQMSMKEFERIIAALWKE